LKFLVTSKLKAIIPHYFKTQTKEKALHNIMSCYLGQVMKPVLLLLLFTIKCKATVRGKQNEEHNSRNLPFVGPEEGPHHGWSQFRSVGGMQHHHHHHHSAHTQNMINNKADVVKKTNINLSGMMQMGMATKQTPSPITSAPIDSVPAKAPTFEIPTVDTYTASIPTADVSIFDAPIETTSRSNAVVTLTGNKLNRKIDDSPFLRSFQSRIVGGNPAAEGEFKFMASLNVGCGGSLIAPNIILTAAHCAGNIKTVRIGSNKANSGGVVKSVTTECMHPNYQSSTTTNDYLLLKLQSPVDISQFPLIQLNNNKAIPQVNQLLTVIGFGSTSEGESGSNTLLKVNVPANSHQQCNQQYGGSIVENVMFCAGNTSGGKDSCQGDSGGPIFEVRSGKPVQVGIVSFGEGCARPNRSGVYSRVSGAYDWIQTTMAKLNNGDTSGCRGGKPSTPSKSPAGVPTKKPLSVPTKKPIRIPTKRPTPSPTQEPSASPVSPVAPTSEESPVTNNADDDDSFWNR
jgi:trypsin